MNRKKTIGLLVAAMGLSLALTGCGETTVQVEGLPQEFHAYEDSGDVNSTPAPERPHIHTFHSKQPVA